MKYDEYGNHPIVGILTMYIYTNPYERARDHSPLWENHIITWPCDSFGPKPRFEQVRKNVTLTLHQPLHCIHLYLGLLQIISSLLVLLVSLVTCKVSLPTSCWVHFPHFPFLFWHPFGSLGSVTVQNFLTAVLSTPWRRHPSASAAATPRRDGAWRRLPRW